METETSPEEQRQDIVVSLSSLMSRSRDTRPLGHTERAIYDTALSWEVRAWLVFHGLNAYQQLCLRNVGVVLPALYATYTDPEGQACRVLLVGTRKGQVLVNRLFDPDGTLEQVRLSSLSDFGPGR